MTTVRAATPLDDAAIARIATAGGADTPPAYLAHLRVAGRLLVAEQAGIVTAFAGMVPVGDVAMVTDLFVDPAGRGGGLGSLLLQHLLDGWPRRMTCSSQHPAALPAYVRAGMQPRGLVHYFRGAATGGGPLLQPAPWHHDRADLVAMWAADGAVVAADVVVQRDAAGAATVHRVVSADGVATVATLLRALPAGTPTTLCVPDWQPVGAWLAEQAFETIDHDIWCATEGVEPDPTLVVVHPGLW